MKTFILVCVLIITSQNTFAQVPDWQWAVQSSGGKVGNAQTAGMCIDQHGNIYILAFFDSTISIGDSVFHADSLLFPTSVRGLFLVKYNSEGKILWAKHPEGTTFGGSGGIALDSQGNCYLGTYTSMGINFENHLQAGYGDFIAKFDSNGNILWVKQLNHSGSFRITALAADKLNNIYAISYPGFATVLGMIDVDTIHVNILGTGLGSVIAKFNSEGSVLWAKQPLFSKLKKIHINGGYNYGNSQAFSLTLSGSVENLEIYIAGDMRTDTLFFGKNYITEKGDSNFSFCAFLARINSKGDCEWVRNVDTNHSASSVCISGGYIYTCGSFAWPNYLDSSNYDFVMQYDRLGTLQWIKKISSPGSQIWVHNMYNVSNNNMCADSYGNLYYSGNFRGLTNFSGTIINPSDTNVWNEFVVKYDKNGNVNWIKQSDSKNVGVFPQGIWYNIFVNPGWAALYNNDLYIAGSFQESVNFGDFHLFRNDNDSNQYNLFLAKLGNATSSVKPNENTSNNQLNIYPNPASAQATVSFNLANPSSISLEIYDILGRLIKRFSYGEINSGEHSEIIDLHELSNGTYVCKIFAKDIISSAVFTVVK